MENLVNIKYTFNSTNWLRKVKYLSDVLIPYFKAKSGYSQIDHVIFTPFAIFVIETKNYAGNIYGDRAGLSGVLMESSL
ncbi:nuclease-related domain-containing protein [Peribacillus sp. NPDC097197]|uniref:nuclease-related domain-containing protein n=1 Tax=Peribacillus sp. NPDC097197 TaxID=3390615 RepID=UPI003D048C4A